MAQNKNTVTVGKDQEGYLKMSSSQYQGLCTFLVMPAAWL